MYQNSRLKLSLLNLDSLLPVVKPLYLELGRPAKNQCELIRSLILMVDFRKQSITDWAMDTTHDPILRILCGFHRGNVPGIASYYDLLAWFWLTSHKSGKLKVRKFRRKPSRKYKANVKLPNRKPGVVLRMVTGFQSGKLPDIRPERVLQEILKHAVVETSAKLGLLGNTASMSVSGDGSPYYAGSNPYGVKVCDCKSKGIHQCDCSRKYADPDASWGWDSYRERWFWGYALFSIIVLNNFFEI